VFVESLGGRATILACKRCNNETFGSKVEGKLQGRNTLLGFKQHLKGDQVKRFDATVKSGGVSVEVDLVSQEVRSRDPVSRQQADPDRVEYVVQGSPPQVEMILQGMAKRFDLSEEQVAKVRDEATKVDLGEKVTVVLKLDLSLAARLTAKVALGALVLARGDEAADSELAESLRQVAFDDDPTVVTVAAAPLDLIREYVTAGGETLGGVSGSTVFIDAPPGSTSVYVLVDDDLLYPAGVVVPGRMPRHDLIGSVVADRPGGPVVLEVSQLLASAAEGGLPDGIGSR
jgi:hypothetical protein